MTTIERAHMATTSTRYRTPAKKAAPRHRRAPQPPPVSAIYTGDPLGLLHQVRADLGITHPDDTNALIEAFLDEAGLMPGTLVSADEVRTFFTPFVRMALRDLLRNIARGVEKTAPLPGQPVSEDDEDEEDEATTSSRYRTPKKTGKKTAKPKVDPVAARRRALAVAFFNGKDFVEWGAATVQDHEGRIAYLSRRRDGITATIARHREAIEMIESAGVTCLNDLEPAA